MARAEGVPRRSPGHEGWRESPMREEGPGAGPRRPWEGAGGRRPGASTGPGWVRAGSVAAAAEPLTWWTEGQVRESLSEQGERSPGDSRGGSERQVWAPGDADEDAQAQGDGRLWQLTGPSMAPVPGPSSEPASPRPEPTGAGPAPGTRPLLRPRQLGRERWPIPTSQTGN